MDSVWRQLGHARPQLAQDHGLSSAYTPIIGIPVALRSRPTRTRALVLNRCGRNWGPLGVVNPAQCHQCHGATGASATGANLLGGNPVPC